MSLLEAQQIVLLRAKRVRATAHPAAPTPPGAAASGSNKRGGRAHTRIFPQPVRALSVIEESAPEQIFDEPRNEGTKAFLEAMLHV